MKTLITRIKRLALALCFATPLVSWAAMEFTDPTYQPWNGVFGAAAWRSDGGNFEVSKVADIAADGTIGEPYAMTWNATVATSGRRFCSACNTSMLQGYVSPGMLLVYDQAGKTAAANATFSPLSFCGLWVKALADETTPYSVTGSGNRATEFGVAGVSSYFKFDKSFTVNRTGTTTFLGDATVEIAQDATFTAQANSSYVVAVDSAATLKLKGAGALAVTTMTVNGTLDLTETTRPTINGDVALAGTIVLPEGTEVSQESPFTVCSGTLSGVNVFVKIGDAEAVEKSFTAENGAITSFGEPQYIFYDNYPTVVPTGKTYTFVGGDSAENTVVVDALDVRGTLKTQGCFSFTNYKSNGSTLDVETGSLTLNPGNNWFNGTLTVEAGATFVNALTDAVQYGGSFTANIYGTLDMGATRWSLGSNNTLNFHEGCTVTGSGDGNNGTFDWIENATGTLNVDGDVNLAAPIRIRSGATVNVNVDTTDQKGLTLAGTIGAGKIVKKGAGLVKFTTNPPYAITVENGAFTFAVDATPTITYSAKPGAGTSMSMWYATQSTWKGTVVLGVLSAPAALPLDAYGNANSKIVLTGTTGSCYLNGTTTVAAEVVVGTDENSVVEFNNGNSDQVGTFSKVSGPGTLKLVGWSGCRAATYVLSTLDNFEGLAIANNITRNEGGTFTVRIGNIVTTRTTDPGDCVLPIANTAVDNATGTVVYDLANAQVNGTALDLEAKDDGIHVVVPTVTITVPPVANANVTVTVGEETIGTAAGDYAVEPGSAVVVTYEAAAGYRLPDGVQSVYNVTADADQTIEVSEDLVPGLLVAKVRNTTTSQYDEYTSLAGALAAAADGNHNPMVTLMANVDEAEVTIGSFVMLIGNYTISSAVTIADGGQLQIQQVTLAGTLTIEDGGVYATGTGTLGTLVAEDGAIIQLSTLSTDSAPLSITTLTVEGNLTVVSSYASAVRGMTYKAISYVTANATIAQGATVAGVNEWSADTTVDGDNTIITLEITAVAKVDGVYYDDAQEAVDAAVESGKPVEFIIAELDTVTLGAGETLDVKGVNQPTVTLDEGLTNPPYEVTHTAYDSVTGITTYTVIVNTVTFAVEARANTTISVEGATDNGDGTYSCAPDTEVTITYTAVGNYVVTGGEKVVTITTATESPIAAPDGMTVNPAVAQIEGGDKYETLAEAVDNVADGDTITLLANVTVTEGITIDVEGAITLDMDGKTITYSPTYATKAEYVELFDVAAGAELTIDGNGTIVGPANGATYDSKVLISVSGTLNYLNGTMTASGSGSDGMYGVYVLDGGTAILGDEQAGTGPTINAHFAAIGTNYTTAPATVTVYGGTYTAAANPGSASTWWSYFCAPVYAASSGDFTISGGTFTGFYGLATRYRSAAQTIAIDGAAFTASSGTVIFYDTKQGQSDPDAVRTITSTDNTLTIPADYKWVETATEGVYQLTAKAYVAQVGSAKFETLAEAFDAAANGDTVTLLADVAVTEGIEIDVEGAVALNMDGKTLTYSPTYATKAEYVELFDVAAGAELTIDGNGTIVGPANGATYDSKVLISVSGTLNYLNGTMTASGSGSDGMYGVYVLDGGTAILGDEQAGTGPTINAHFAAIGTNYTTAPATVTVYGGTYTAAANPGSASTWWSYFCAPVYAASSGDFTISGGTFTGFYGLATRYRSAAQTIAIDGAAFTASSGTVIFYDTKQGQSDPDAVRTITSTDNTLTVSEGYRWVATETTGVYQLAEESQGIDPESDDPSQEVTAADEDAAIAAATVVIPDDVASDTGAAAAMTTAAEAAGKSVDELYKSYFKYEATETSAGVYTVTMTDIADKVVEDANDDALTSLQEAVADSTATAVSVEVPAGLYYKVETFDTLGGEPVDTQKGLSSGTTTPVTKPTGTTQGFIKVTISAKAVQ